MCVRARTHNMASRFPGQTLSFCACHILLSVAHTPSLIPHIPLSPPTSIQTLINRISQNGIRFITPRHTQRRENTTTSAYTHTLTQQFLVYCQFLKLNFSHSQTVILILFCCYLPGLQHMLFGGHFQKIML